MIGVCLTPIMTPITTPIMRFPLGMLMHRLSFLDPFREKIGKSIVRKTSVYAEGEL